MLKWSDGGVTLSGAHFLTGPICTFVDLGLGCNQFLGSEDGDQVWFYLQNRDDWHGAHIVEQTSSGGWLEITGHAIGPFDGVSSIEVAGTADVWFCPISSGYPFPCSQVRSCQSTDLHLRFNRK